MRWKSGRRSSNIEDRRGIRISKKTAAGGGLTTIVLVLVAMYFGIDPGVVMQVANQGQGTEERVEKVTLSATEQELTDFVSVVLADTEDTWHAIFHNVKNGHLLPENITAFLHVRCGKSSAAD